MENAAPFWFNNSLFGIKMVLMESRRPRQRVKRSTVSLDAGDYGRICAIAARHRPPLPVRYVIEYAVTRFLDSVGDGTDARVDMTSDIGLRQREKAAKR